MSRVSGCLWLGVALVLALVAGGAAFITLQKATVTQASQAPVATSQVVVAVHPVEVGTVLAEGDLALQSLPAGALPSGALAAVTDAAGQVTMVPLNTGEMVLSHHLTHPDITAANASFTLPEGKVAVSLPADDLLSNLQLIKAGDRVDILYSIQLHKVDTQTDKASEDQQYTFGSLTGATVVSVVRSLTKDAGGQTGDGSNNPAASVGVAKAYILALPPQEALVLKYLKDADAVMDLALRNVTDETDHTAKPVDAGYIVDKYQLPVK